MHERRHYRDYTGTQSLSLHYEAGGRGWGCVWGWCAGLFVGKQGTFFTTMGVGALEGFREEIGCLRAFKYFTSFNG